MLQRKWRMQKTAQYQITFHTGKSCASKYVIGYACKAKNTRIGFIASKKIGNAVKRNRAKRLMREVLRLNLSHLTGEYHLVFIARKSICHASFKDVEKSVLYVLRRVGVINGYRY